LFKAFLEFRSLTSHDGEKQFTILFPVLQDYGIVRKLRYIINDNYNINNKFYRTISIYLSGKKKIDWNPIYHRIRYNDHIINLIIYSFLF
jgi:hypothetical protein